MNPRIRNLIPPIYGVLILAGFLIAPIAGIVVLIVGGALSGILWSALSGGPRASSAATSRDDGTREDRAAARAARRAGRR